MKFSRRLKLSSNISNIYQIAGIPKATKCDRTGEEEILPFNYYKYIVVRSVAKETSVCRLIPVLKKHSQLSDATFS